MRIRILITLTTLYCCVSYIKSLERATYRTSPTAKEDHEYLDSLERGFKILDFPIEGKPFINYIKDYRFRIDNYGHQLSEDEKLKLEIELGTSLALWAK